MKILSSFIYNFFRIFIIIKYTVINLFSWDERFFFSESNVGNDTSVVSCKAYVVDGTSIKPVSDKDESNMTLCPKTSIPNVMSSVYIENNRDKPFIVYINGVRKGVIRAYKEI